MWFGSLVVIVLLVVLVIALTRQPPRSDASDDREKAFRILDERLARGEIDEGEYERTRKILERSRR
jgi:uncharacterized membrane protein